MKRKVLLPIVGVILFLLLFLVLKPVHAITEVKIEGNGEGSSSHVEVHNEVNSSSSNTSTTTDGTRTHIRIETNGKVKEYDSDKPEDVTIQSEDGSAKVHINNSGNVSEAGSKLQKEGEKVKKEVEEKAKNESPQGFISGLMDFLQKELNSLRNFFNF